jgi:hypothetical protein
MNEIEKLDLIVDYLVRTKSRLGSKDLIRDLNLKISEAEAKYLCNRLIEDGVVDSFSTPLSEVIIIKYTHDTQRIFDLGGYAKLETNRIAEEEKQAKLKSFEEEKLILETKLAKWQAKTFWWIFLFALLGGICGIISLLMQLF